MRNCLIISLFAFLCGFGYSQQLTHHLGDSVYFVTHTAVKDSLSIPSVQLRLDTACFHEHANDNSSIALFRIVNKTDQFLFVPGELICWDDSGFMQSGHFQPDRQHSVPPGGNAEIRVQIRGTGKYSWSKSGSFTILSKKGQSYTVPISLRLFMSPGKCLPGEQKPGED